MSPSPKVRILSVDDHANIPELETPIRSESDGQRIALESKDVTLVGRDAITFVAKRTASDSSIARLRPRVDHETTTRR
jgi:hypothetical protein